LTDLERIFWKLRNPFRLLFI